MTHWTDRIPTQQNQPSSASLTEFDGVGKILDSAMNSEQRKRRSVEDVETWRHDQSRATAKARRVLSLFSRDMLAQQAERDRTVVKELLDEEANLEVNKSVQGLRVVFVSPPGETFDDDHEMWLSEARACMSMHTHIHARTQRFEWPTTLPFGRVIEFYTKQQFLDSLLLNSFMLTSIYKWRADVMGVKIDSMNAWNSEPDYCFRAGVHKCTHAHAHVHAHACACTHAPVHLRAHMCTGACTCVCAYGVRICTRVRACTHAAAFEDPLIWPPFSYETKDGNDTR